MEHWLPAILWMALIFFASSDALSSQRTSRFLVPLIRWLGPQLTPAQVDEIQLIVRKTAHVIEYTVLGLLLWRALRSRNNQAPQFWSWKQAGWAFCLATAYAASDELHQLFVVSRWASIGDVLLDSLGAAFGLLLALAWVWHQKPRSQPAHA